MHVHARASDQLMATCVRRAPDRVHHLALNVHLVLGMSAPSFSSFPPSFGSFPDPAGEAGPSTARHGKDKRKTKDRKDKKDKKDRDRHKHRDREHKHDKSRSGSETHGAKINEDHDDRVEHDLPASGSRPLFYSDRKGDLLNVKYGGLHSGDVPRYRPVGRELLGWRVVHG